MVKTLKRFLDMDDAKKSCAWGCYELTFPPDPWGTSVNLVIGYVRERVYQS